MAADIRQRLIETARGLGISPVDLATAISYETAGTFDPTKRGPTTKWGQHRGLIQFGEPQAQKYGVDWNNPIESQLGEGKAVARYLTDAGVKPGMGMLDIYSAINAGGVGPQYHGRSDTAAGGAPGTVADKVNNQMAGHRKNAMGLLGDYSQMPDGPKGQESYGLAPATAPQPGGILYDPSIPQDVADFAASPEPKTLGERLQGAFKALADTPDAPMPRLGPMGDARATGDSLLKALNAPKLSDLLLQKRMMG